jgi:hypothetical protein
MNSRAVTDLFFKTIEELVGALVLKLTTSALRIYFRYWDVANVNR